MFLSFILFPYRKRERKRERVRDQWDFNLIIFDPNVSAATAAVSIVIILLYFLTLKSSRLFNMKSIVIANTIIEFVDSFRLTQNVYLCVYDIYI